jgi:GT2 family glycosyltransferase
MAPSIDVVVPVHGGWELTHRCLETLAAQTVHHRVYVVDNASPDDTARRVSEEWAGVDLVPMGGNRGYSAAVNAGAAAGVGEVVVVLNNDVECDPDFLQQLVAPMENEPRVGMTTPLLLRPGREKVDGAGLVVDATIAAWPRLQGRPAAEAHAGDGVHAGPSGAAGAFRREALEGIGGFDERIFLYGEDLDAVLRLRAAGWEAALVPEAVAVHVGGASTGRRSRWQRQQFAWARGYLLRRWGVLHTRAAARTLLLETAVAVGDLAASRDLAALTGRVAGWRAARGLERRELPREALDPMGWRENVRRRRGDYADAAAS